MRLVTLATATAALALMAAPALAQEAPAAQPAPAQAAPAAPSPAEAAIQAEAEKFEAGVEQMQAELVALRTAAGADAAKYQADSQPVVARYQPQADAFADALTAFAADPASGVPAEAQAQIAQGVAQIRSVPTMMRDQIGQATPEQLAGAQAPAAAPQ
ncbi:translation initiation factor IF-2 [Brevundimonas sp. S30B]|uniref:translation initiation factor IF-2 n=1 Tax=unclassified Brevundimonas TaxID=2622653 RepID=UPI0010720B23|nr:MULTISPECIES: translation initiation factor IF-2 [unclassified Brevundimonas]QBX37042.1 translation initiation factor IF-2 [Brevundimonas sp. MF30-B]TFW04162.1 translation initiation factor IF-2 [Brevundimonas sp. S30B]